LLAAASFTAYHIVTTHPSEPITNIIKNVTKPAFSIINAPSLSVIGSIKEMSGEVKWQSRIATQSSEIKNPITLQQGEEIETGETGSLTVEFPNEAVIRIMPKTQINFVQTLPVNFVTSVVNGGATFTKTANTPVSIRAMHLLIKQNSGDLSIGVDTENSLVNINILKGSVTIAYNDLNLISHVTNIDAGKRITFNDSSRKFE